MMSAFEESMRSGSENIITKWSHKQLSNNSKQLFNGYNFKYIDDDISHNHDEIHDYYTYTFHCDDDLGWTYKLIHSIGPQDEDQDEPQMNLGVIDETNNIVYKLC